MADEKLNILTLAMAKKYTDNSLAGAGAVAGVPCQIQSITPITGGNRVTFLWEDNNNVSHTSTLDVMDGAKGDKGEKGDTGIQGLQGEKGVGIESITKKSSAGLVDTYQIVFTDGTESSFDVVNGANITKTSQLENDSNFITNVVNNLLNYYTKDEVYTKANIDELLRNVGAGLSVKIVTVLPTEEISGTTIYLIKTSGHNYNQYMWIDNAWANLGSTTVDLSNYYTKDKVDEILLGYVTKDVLASVLIDYVKKSELAKVATSNDYNDLDNLPQIPDVSGIKPYTNVLQDSDGTAPTSKALYDAVSTLQTDKADASDLTAHTDNTDIHVTKELKDKLVTTDDIATTISSTSTDSEVPTAKAVNEKVKTTEEAMKEFLKYEDITSECVFRTDAMGSNGKLPRVYKNCNSIVIIWDNVVIDAVGTDLGYGHIKIPKNINYDYIIMEGSIDVVDRGMPRGIARVFVTDLFDDYLYVSITGQMYTGKLTTGVDAVRGITEYKYIEK